MGQAQADGARREVELTRTGSTHFEARNVRGGRIAIGSGGDADFTPVELLLAAMAGCSAVDVDMLTARHAEPTEFTVVASGQKVDDEQGHHMTDLEVTFTVRFGDGDGADTARERLPRAVEASRDRLCTVSRTVALGTPVAMRVAAHGTESAAGE